MSERLPLSGRQLLVLAICVALFALGQFHRASGSVFTPILMDRFALSATAIASLVSAMFLASIAAQLPFGAALDRFGPRMILTASVVTVAAGTLWFAFAPSYSDTLGSRILIGLGFAASGAGMQIVISRNFAPRQFGYIMGLVVSLGGIGGLMGTYPLALALARLPWTAVFVSVAAATLVLAALIRAVLAPRKAAGDPKVSADDRSGGYTALMRQPEIWKILVLGVVTYAPITTITGLWGGPYFQDVHLLSAETTGTILFALFGAAISGGYIFGRLDRSDIPRRRIIVSAFALSGVCLATLAILPEPSAATAFALLLAMIFCQQFYIPLGVHLRGAVPAGSLGRAFSLFTLVAVTAIPAAQTGFGAVLDLARNAGLETSEGYRIAYAAMAATILACGGIYTTAKKVNDA